MFGSDITREVVDAFRDRGFRIGLYFSIIDRHHPDYPRYTDETVTKPYTVGSYPRVAPAKWQRYRDFMVGQLDELLTGYGDLDILWLDGEFEHTPEEWRFDEIRALIRARQPRALVNDRCLGHGDFATPEQQLPVPRHEALRAHRRARRVRGPRPVGGAARRLTGARVDGHPGCGSYTVAATTPSANSTSRWTRQTSNSFAASSWSTWHLHPTGMTLTPSRTLGQQSIMAVEAALLVFSWVGRSRWACRRPDTLVGSSVRCSGADA